jgi:SNF2 family DNA or RNA helicase
MGMRRAAFLSAHQPGTLLDLTGAERSAKLDRLLDIIEEAAEDDLKVLVFSYFRDVLDLVTAAARLVQPQSVFGPLTGSVPPNERQRLVDAFSCHGGPGVLTAQIEAGGTGLNIQAASIVVLCEPQWKPSIEAQAVARAHRMGQVRRVQVHRLLTPEGVDEHMLRILAGKSELFDEYVTRSAIKDLTPEAVDVSDLAEVASVASQAEAERQIVEAERRRFGFEGAGAASP